MMFDFLSLFTSLPPNVQFLPSKVKSFWDHFKPPSHPKIGHHLWTLPNLNQYDLIFCRREQEDLATRR